MVRSNLGLEHDISDRQTVHLNLTQSYLERTGEDEVSVFNRSYESPNDISKNLVGLAYVFRDPDLGIDATVFGKRYWYSGRIVTQDFEGNDVVTEPSLTRSGFGFAASYDVAPGVQVKSSFEKAFRIPESFEILGDGIYVNPNPLLSPERSHNANLGLRLSHRASFLSLNAESNLFYRNSKDFIRFNPLGPFGEYENLNNVRTAGIESNLGLNYRDAVTLNATLTYQNLTDQTEFDEGLPNTNYKSRVPNIPYLFGNVRLGYSPLILGESTRLNLYWSLRYIHEFFLTWEDLGDPDAKNTIPEQVVHDLQAEFILADGTYNVSLSVNNVADTLAYDNFNIQKPGRSVHVKVRYFHR